MSDPRPSAPAAPAAPAGRSAIPQRFVRSMTSNYLNSLVAALLALLVTPLLVRGLGKDAFGVWTIVSASVLYYSVLQFGLSRAAVKFVAESHAAGDDARAGRVISTAFLALAGPALLLLVAAPGLGLLFPAIFDVPEEYRQAAIVLVVISTIDFAIGMPSDTFSSGLVGLQRFDLLNATTTGTAVAQAGAWVVVLALGGGLVALGIATITFSVISNVVRWLMVRRLLRGLKIAPSTFERRLVGPLVRMSGWIALSDFVEVITAKIDPIVVGLLVGVPQAGVYAVGQKLSALVERLSGPALSMFFPHAAALSAHRDHEGLRRTLLAGTRLSMGLTVPLALVVSVLAEPAVRVWVGDGFDEAAPVVVYLSLTTLVVALTRVGVYVLRGLGDVAFAARVGVLEAFVSLGASVALGKAMGLEGVALGTLVGVSCNHLLLLLPYISRELGVPVRRLLLVVARAQALPAAVALAAGFALRPFADGGFLPLLVAGAAVLAAYLPLFAVTGLSADERGRLATLVKRRREAG